ncbi:hypothetical protein GCM10020220_098840 [Nonomuraea rubra]
MELDVVGARTSVSQLIGEEQPDLVLLNDDDLTYAKVRLDEDSLRTLVDGGINAFTESLPRALCWTAAWDMTRDGEMSTRDYVKLVVSGVATVSDITVLQTVLRQARLAVQQYADPAWRAEGLSLLATRAARAARLGRARLRPAAVVPPGVLGRGHLRGGPGRAAGRPRRHLGARRGGRGRRPALDARAGARLRRSPGRGRHPGRAGAGPYGEG